MRTIVAGATFVAVGAITAGVGALDNIQMRGSDTLNQITLDVLAACTGTSGLTYIGTGSSNGEQDLLTGAQTVSPMSRFLTGGRTCNYPNAATTKDASKAEGLAFALDGLSIVMATASAGPCNTGASDCNAATDPDSGLARNRVVNLPAGGTYSFNNWTDVLRVVYGGMLNNGANNISNRDCNSAVRQAVVGAWNNLFQADCPGSTCTQLAHAFRRDDESGTTDVFIALLNLPALNLQTGVSPFCNAIQPVAAGPNRPPYFPEFQDNDPIRRACVGTGNIPLPPATEPPTAPTEQVCSKDGTLGVVIPINPAPVRTQSPLAYPTTPCARGKLIFGSAPKRSATAFDRCPNGDLPAFINKCLVPADANNSAQCIAGRNSLPLLKLDPVGANAVDGRVYNLHTRHADGTYQTIKRPGTQAGTTVEAELVGSFYRIHTTRTALAAPSTTGVCTQPDATLQLGCVAQANPCSMSYAGREATTIANTVAVKLNALEPTTECVRNLITGAGAPYPFSRKLYINSMAGFETVTGQERALAQCFATEATVEPIITANGFITLGQDVFCEDFAENTCAGQTSTNNACTGNPF